MKIKDSLQQSLVNIQTWIFLKQLLRSYPKNPRELENIQLRKLRRLLIYSYENHEFYRERMDKGDLNPYKLTDVKELRKLPLLTKEDYRSFTNSQLVDNPEKYKNWHFDQTSGSTGTPLRIVRTWTELGYMNAKWLRAVYMNGYRCTDKTLRIIAPHKMTGGRSSFLQHIGLFRFTKMSTFSSGSEMAEAFQRINPDFFYANRTLAADLAQYILETGKKIQKPRLYSVGSEIIDENSKNLLNRVFGSDNFFEYYGCEEMGSLAFQLKGMSGLEFCHDTNILELINPDGSISQTTGECIITDLGILSFPMIRYRLGDLIDTDTSAAGIPRIKNIQGRTDDWLLWEDGSRTSRVYPYSIMGRYSQQISRFRIIQETWNLIRVLIILGPGLHRNAEKNYLRDDIIKKMRDKIRPDITVQVEYVNNLPHEKNGKLRTISSKVDKDEWQKKADELREMTRRQAEVSN